MKILRIISEIKDKKLMKKKINRVMKIKKRKVKVKIKIKL
jgi:hypothetical protein